MSPPDRIRDRPPVNDRPLERSRTPEKPNMAFDSVLSQTRAAQNSPGMQQQQSREHDTDDNGQRKDRDKGKERTRDRDRGRTRERTAAHHDTAATNSRGTATARAVTRQSQEQKEGEQGHSRGGGKQQRQQQGGAHHAHETSTTTETNEASATLSPTANPIAARFKSQLAHAAQTLPTRFDATQMQRLINQLVQAVRLGKTLSGDDLMQIGFAAHVFKGLRCEFTKQGDAVHIRFLSDDRTVRELFSREREAIAKRLQAKGVELGGIEVVESSA